jgi:hypothetical protein
MNDPQQNPNWITTHLLETYLAHIRGTLGSRAYRHRYVHRSEEPEKTIDITRDGEISCAFYTSLILTSFGLIDMHSAVRGTLSIHSATEGILRDLPLSGWYEIPEPRVGSVLIWESRAISDGSLHRHSGFYMGDDKAISHVGNDIRAPHEHDWRYVPPNPQERTVESIWWHDKLV